VDIALVTVLAYVAIHFLRRASAHLALVGIGIVGGLYLLARLIGLTLTAWIFQGFFAAFLLLIVVIFQTDLRRAFERIAIWGLRRVPQTPPVETSAQLVSAVAKLAATRRGALIVIPGHDPLDRHLKGGIALDGRLSEPLLLSLFDPHSPGHDGAVLLDGEWLRRFALHLPLSGDSVQIGAHGTRHASALGLAECTDALCIVVSEEYGTVSVARAGKLLQLSTPAALTQVLAEFRQETLEGTSDPVPQGSPFSRLRVLSRVQVSWKIGAAALATSIGLWLVVIPGSEVGEARFEVRVAVINVPPGFEVDRIEPAEITIVATGLRRDLLFLSEDAFRVEVDADLVRYDRRTFRIGPESVLHPPALQIRSIQPDRLRLVVHKN